MAIRNYALVTYDFASQHFGALSLYRMRAERAGCACTRRLDRIFALGLGGALVFLVDILAGSSATRTCGSTAGLFLPGLRLLGKEQSVKPPCWCCSSGHPHASWGARTAHARCRLCFISWDSPRGTVSRAGK
jgi:hypothetical protein